MWGGSLNFAYIGPYRSRVIAKSGAQWHVGMTTSRHCCSSSSDATQGDGGNLRSTGGHGQTSKTNSCAERSLGRPPRRPRSPLRRGPASAALSAVYRIPYRSRVMSKIRILNIFFQGCPSLLWFLWHHDFDSGACRGSFLTRKSRS